MSQLSVPPQCTCIDQQLDLHYIKYKCFIVATPEKLSISYLCIAEDQLTVNVLTFSVAQRFLLQCLDRVG